MKVDFAEALSKAWTELDHQAISQLGSHFRSSNQIGNAKVLEALSSSLRGELSVAVEKYATINEPVTDPTLKALFEIDYSYNLTRLQRYSQRIPISKRLGLLINILLKGSRPLKVQVIHHGLYSWYITAFWYNHSESFLAGILLLFYGLCFGKRQAVIHGSFLVGHLFNVRGFPSLGVPLVKYSYRNLNRIDPWLKVPILSYMAYGLYMVGRADELIPDIIAYAELALKSYPDSFHHILLHVSVLRFSSQIGNVEVAENVAQKLIAFSGGNKLHKFYFSSKADLALCYGIRGLYWKCDEILKELETFDDLQANPVESASFYRLRGWAYFFVGKYSKALQDSKRALELFNKTRSFYLATSMSKILFEVASFRVNLESSADVGEAFRISNKYIRSVAALKSSFSKHPVLRTMIEEEEKLLHSSLSRLLQPGYSRTSNVIHCQHDLQSHYNSISLAESDRAAWSIIEGVIGPRLNVKFESLINVAEFPGFEARSYYGKTKGVEFVVERAKGRDSSTYDIVRFEKANGQNLVSVLDGVYTLLGTINSLFKIRDQQHEILSSERNRAFSELASQVAHDIRSPLAALMSAERDLKLLPEDTRVLIRGAVNRIRDIANNLLEQNKKKVSIQSFDETQNSSKNNKMKNELLASLLDSIVSEKRLQYRSHMGIEIELNLEKSSYGLFAQIDPIEFKRVISNLVNNSVEAFDGSKGHVAINLKKAESVAIIEITDNGKGISPELLATLTKRGESFGKENGSGLGLYHARTSIEEWQGTLAVSSQLGLGTTIALHIPLSNTPDWFVEKLIIPSDAQILVLDDDASIHQVWQSRFEVAGIRNSRVKLAHASTPEKAGVFVHEFGTDKTVYLVDFELLGSKQSGLDVIEKHQLQNRAILVTSRFEEPTIRERCHRLGVKLIPKGMAAIVPIVLEESKLHFDAVLIDDDPLVHLTWTARARSQNKTIKCYSRPNDFFMVSNVVSATTPLYIDSNLGSGVTGTEVAEDLHRKGFKNIYLATGYEAESLGSLTFLKGVIGKEPPF